MEEWGRSSTPMQEPERRDRSRGRTRNRSRKRDRSRSRKRDRSRSGNRSRGPSRTSGAEAGAGRPWVFKRNASAEHKLGIPSRSREGVAETYPDVGVPSTASVNLPVQSRLSGVASGSGIGSGSPLRLAAPAPEKTGTPKDKPDHRGAKYFLPDRVSEKPESLKTLTWGLRPSENPVLN